MGRVHEVLRMCRVTDLDGTFAGARQVGKRPGKVSGLKGVLIQLRFLKGKKETRRITGCLDASELLYKSDEERSLEPVSLATHVCLQATVGYPDVDADGRNMDYRRPCFKRNRAVGHEPRQFRGHLS
ncbi:MAG: hypothetical protein M3O70_20450 [Actinomycetota bacterium]|nr:hypothetical protein [Actinomycetota bacterium]